MTTPPLNEICFVSPRSTRTRTTPKRTVSSCSSLRSLDSSSCSSSSLLLLASPSQLQSSTKYGGSGAMMMIPHEYVCPLTNRVFSDPVITKDGGKLNFERSAILKWLEEHDNTCPVTLHPLKPSELERNEQLQVRISIWKELKGIPSHDSILFHESPTHSRRSRRHDHHRSLPTLSTTTMDQQQQQETPKTPRSSSSSSSSKTKLTLSSSMRTLSSSSSIISHHHRSSLADDAGPATTTTPELLSPPSNKTAAAAGAPSPKSTTTLELFKKSPKLLFRAAVRSTSKAVVLEETELFKHRS